MRISSPKTRTGSSMILYLPSSVKGLLENFLSDVFRSASVGGED